MAPLQGASPSLRGTYRGAPLRCDPRLPSCIAPRCLVGGLSAKDWAGGSWVAAVRVCACIGTMNLEESPSPLPSPRSFVAGRGRIVASLFARTGSWRAPIRVGACIGTMNRGRPCRLKVCDTAGCKPALRGNGSWRAFEGSGAGATNKNNDCHANKASTLPGP